MVNATHRGYVHSCGERAVRSLTGDAAAVARAPGLLVAQRCLARMRLCRTRPRQAESAQKPKMKDADAATAKVETSATGQRAYAGRHESLRGRRHGGCASSSLPSRSRAAGFPIRRWHARSIMRGAAARRLGRPAQAISDLTTAVWLKGGLSDDRQGQSHGSSGSSPTSEAGLGRHAAAGSGPRRSIRARGTAAAPRPGSRRAGRAGHASSRSGAGFSMPL